MKTSLRVAPLMLVAGMLFGSRAGLAHEPPLGRGIWWVPGDAGERTIIETNRGLLVSTDDGGTFKLLCDEAIGGAASEPLPVAPADRGRLSVATFGEGLITSSPDLCTWQPSPMAALASMPAFDVLSVPTTGAAGAALAQYTLAGTGASSTALYVSRDGGGSWSAMGAASQAAYTRVRVAPSDPRRLYRTGVDLGAGGQLEHKLSVSTDGGETDTTFLVPLAPGELQARILAVDPRDPDRIYLRAEATSVELPERLLVSPDGGRTFTTALSLVAFGGFALSPDGATLWAGGSEGIWRSTDRGEHFTRLDDAQVTRVGCLGFHAGRLFACGVRGNDFEISVSSDGGETFGRLLAFSDVATAIDCPAASQVGVACRAPTIHWRQELLVAPPGAAGGGAGGSSPGPGASSSATTARASGCDVAGGADRSALESAACLLPWAVLAAGLAVRWARRRAAPAGGRKTGDASMNG